MYLKCGLMLRSRFAVLPFGSLAPGDVTDVPTNSTAREPSPVLAL